MNVDWHNCYSEGWQNEIVPEAFSHPAKFSRALIRRIYAHALERGYLKPGDTCLDPFGGVALGAADALTNGLNFVGVELEQNFVDLGAGCDCTGISKADWARCFGRWDRFRYKDGRHWCPRCLAEAGQISKERKAPEPGQAQAKRRARMRELMTRTGRKVDFSLYDPFPFPESRERQTPNAARLFGAEQLVASYERNSGKIPHTEPHRYAGNLDLFARHARNGATAVLVQGDSRNLVEVLERARAEGIIASPPFTSSLCGGKNSGIKWELIHGSRWSKDSEEYGTDPANLGNMPTGEPPSAVISSPPLGKAQSGGTSFWEGLEEKHNRTFSDTVREGSQGYRGDQLGDTDGQLGTMPTGEPPQAVISSPPHGHDTEPHGDLRPDDGRAMRRTAERSYGESDGQLAAMREGDVDAVIASPPGLEGRQHSRRQSRVIEDQGIGSAYEHRIDAYGTSDGQLAALPEGELPQVDGLVSSPPYEGNPRAVDKLDGKHLTVRQNPRYPGEKLYFTNYAQQDSEGNLGNQQSDTFWAASRLILLQCHQVLAPGGVAIWVLKAFVRNKAIVDFPGQWEALCNSCGFEIIEVIKAWLVEDRGAQFALNGDLVEKKVASKSFFRRLHEKKYPDLAIDWEIVLITRKVGIS